MVKINKKIILIAVSIVLAIAGLICVQSATAVNSPVAPEAKSGGVVFRLSWYTPANLSVPKVASTSKVASNVPAGETPAASFEVTSSSDDLSSYTSATLTIGAENATSVAGKPCKIYIQHHDGSTEVINNTFNNAGSVTFTVNKLSVFSVVADMSGGSQSGENVSSISPQTGIY